MTETSEETGESGGTIPGADAPAYRLSLARGTPIPVLIAAPHAGRCYPADVVERMRDPAYAALRLEDRHIDLVAKSVAQATGAGLLVANAPRAMLDLNRSPDDVDWSMIVGGLPRDRRDGTRHSLANRRARCADCGDPPALPRGARPRARAVARQVGRGAADRLSLDAAATESRRGRAISRVRAGRSFRRQLRPSARRRCVRLLRGA